MTMLGGELTDEEFEKFRTLIYRVAGIRIAENKKLMITNRLRRRLRGDESHEFLEYLAYLTSPAGSREIPLFLESEITTNETYFYRDIQHYEWFSETFLPEVARRGFDRKRPKEPESVVGGLQYGRGAVLPAIKVMAARHTMPNWSIGCWGLTSAAPP